VSSIFNILGSGASLGLNYLGQQQIQSGVSKIQGAGGSVPSASAISGQLQNLSGNFQSNVSNINASYVGTMEGLKTSYQSQSQSIIQQYQSGAIDRNTANQQLVNAQQSAVIQAQQVTESRNQAMSQAQAQAKSEQQSIISNAQRQAENARRQVEEGKAQIKQGMQTQQSAPFAGGAVSGIGNFIDDPNLYTGGRVVGQAAGAGIAYTGLIPAQPLPAPLGGLAGGNLIGAVAGIPQLAGGLIEFGDRPGAATQLFEQFAGNLPGYGLYKAGSQMFNSFSNLGQNQLATGELTSLYNTGQILGGVSTITNFAGQAAGLTGIGMVGTIGASFLGNAINAAGQGLQTTALAQSNLQSIYGNIAPSFFEPVSEQAGISSGLSAFKPLGLPVGAIGKLFGADQYDTTLAQSLCYTCGQSNTTTTNFGNGIMAMTMDLRTPAPSLGFNAIDLSLAAQRAGAVVEASPDGKFLNIKNLTPEMVAKIEGELQKISDRRQQDMIDDICFKQPECCEGPGDNQDGQKDDGKGRYGQGEPPPPKRPDKLKSPLPPGCGGEGSEPASAVSPEGPASNIPGLGGGGRNIEGTSGVRPDVSGYEPGRIAADIAKGFAPFKVGGTTPLFSGIAPSAPSTPVSFGPASPVSGGGGGRPLTPTSSIRPTIGGLQAGSRIGGGRGLR